MNDFYIVSTKHTRNDSPYICFWRPNDAGYCYPLSWAGKYPSEVVQSKPGYYTSGESTFAVPCDFADAMAGPPAPRMIDNDAGPVIPNTPQNRRALASASAFPTMAAIEWQWYSRKKGSPGRFLVNCSGCGRFVSDVDRYSTNCPNCGADNRP